MSISACLFTGLFPLAGISSAGPAFDELVRAAGGEELAAGPSNRGPTAPERRGSIHAAAYEWPLAREKPPW